MSATTHARIIATGDEIETLHEGAVIVAITDHIELTYGEDA